MRKRLLPVAWTVAALACLASCATPAARNRTLTVELFDSRSVVAAAPATSSDMQQLPMPQVQDATGPDVRVRGGGSAQHAELSAVPAPSPLGTATPAVDSLPLPLVGADIQGSAAAIVGLAALPSLRRTPTFPLAQPIAPAAAPAGRAPVQSVSGTAAQRPTASKTAAAGAAAPAPVGGSASTPSGSTATSGATPAPAAATSAPSTAAAGQASSAGSGTAAGAAPAASTVTAPYGQLREIYARVGDEMQIGLDGTGFLFLGFSDNQTPSDGMSFKSKEIRTAKTWFTFQALKLGTYDLDFVQQDNSTGKSTKETVRVHVVTDQDFTAAVGQQPAQDGSSPVETGDPAFADKLASLGATEAAITELQKGYKDGNAVLNDQLARLYARIGSWDAAGKYYQKNLSLSGPYTNAAVLGLVRVAAAERDQTGLLAQLKRFLAIQDPAAEEPMLLAIRMERDLGQAGVGLDLAAEYASRYPQGRWLDEVEFIAAQFLETDSPFRDIARARDLYSDVVTTYPVGDFAAAARARLEYIERHFFQVR